jgi:hypothetical protein
MNIGTSYKALKLQRGRRVNAMPASLEIQIDLSLKDWLVGKFLEGYDSISKNAPMLTALPVIVVICILVWELLPHSLMA